MLKYVIPEDEVISVAAVDKVRVVVVAEEIPSSEFSLPLFKVVVLLLGLTLWRPLRGLLLLCLDLVLFRPPPEDDTASASSLSSALSSFLDFRDLLLEGFAFSGLGEGLGSGSHDEPPSSSNVSALSPTIWRKKIQKSKCTFLKKIIVEKIQKNVDSGLCSFFGFYPAGTCHFNMRVVYKSLGEG